MADDDFDLIGESFEPERDLYSKVTLPPEERVRRTAMVVLAVLYVLLLCVNLGFALTLSPARYVAVGAAIASAMSVVAGLLGGTIAYYFTKRN